MINEVLSFFAEKKVRTFIDATCGAGGHSAAMLEAHPELETLYAVDQDPHAITMAKHRLAPYGGRVEFHRANFSALKNIPRGSCDGVLFDLGVSSMQFDEGARGFSFSHDGPLDMRMDPHGDTTAEDIVNSFSEVDLAKIIFEYGQEPRSRKIASLIRQARSKKRITTTGELRALIESHIPRRGRIHPATLTFQALRIAVNDELGNLGAALRIVPELLSLGGRVVVISFHSLEDRCVKMAFRSTDTLLNLTKKPLVPTRQEERVNPRARSAKLRAAEKISSAV
jgi:16S rRNA (cytosine1402-N4)-methyltransferase